MNDANPLTSATKLSATALILQDGTIVTLAPENGQKSSYLMLAMQVVELTWRRIAVAAIVGIALGLILYIVSPRKYQASIIIESGPVAQSLDQDGKFTGVLGGGVRGLLGGSGALPQMTKDFLQLLHSNMVGGELLKNQAIRKKLFGDQWDPTTQSWHAPRGIIATLASGIKVLTGRPAWTPPGPEHIKKYLDMNLTISPLGDGMLQQVSVVSSDPKWSAYLLNETIRAADQYLRVRESRRSQASIKYWQQQIDSSGAQDIRAALIGNIVDAKRRVVFANVDLPFAVEVVDPVIIPTLPVGPSPLFMIGLSVALCIVLSFLPMLVRYVRAKLNREEDEYVEQERQYGFAPFSWIGSLAESFTRAGHRRPPQY